MTPQQSKLLALLREREAAGAVPPSVREMAAALGLRSTSGVHRMLSALEQQGHLTRSPGEVRSIKLVHAAPVDLSAVPTDDLRAELARREGRVT